MKEILSVTIDGDTYRKYKELYEATKNSKIAIHFGHSDKFNYEWELFTKDDVIIEMAKNFEFIQFKHNEQQAQRIASLKQEIESLNKKLADANTNNHTNNTKP